MARTASPAGTPGAQITKVFATQKDVIVRITASSKPIVYTRKPEDAFCSEAGIAGLSPGATCQCISVMEDPHQIDNGEYQNPDDVERVPEQGEAVQAAHHDVLEAPQ